MSKILFNNTIIETTSSTECTSGLNVIFTIYPSEVSNTVTISKSSNIGQHAFTDAVFDSVTGISNLSKTLGEKLILTFDYDSSVANQAIVVTARVLIAEAKLSVFKAELGVDSEIIDYLTIDCKEPAVGEIIFNPITPTPTSTATPTPSTTNGSHSLYERVYIYDSTGQTDFALDLNEDLFKNNTLEKYQFSELNNKFSNSNTLYVRKEKENVIYKVQDTGDSDASVVDFILCPSPTPTPSFSPTNTVTPTVSPTVTLTPTNTASATQTNTPTNTATPTVTVSSTHLLESKQYYLSHISDDVCSLPPKADDIVPYHTTKKFTVDRFTIDQEILSNEFDMNCSNIASFIVEVGNLTLNNDYTFTFSVAHPSERQFAKIEPATETFKANESKHNINIVASYTGNSTKFLIKLTIKDDTADITEDEFFIFNCVDG